VTEPIFHLALARDWEAAPAAGEYAVSTLGRTLAEEGFIHASHADQWRAVRDRFYSEVAEPLVLLVIDPSLLTAEVREEAVPGLAEHLRSVASLPRSSACPHIYGPVNLDAVVRVVEVAQ
jgi:uncharacterized protein (DUF952 family)